MRVVLDTNIVCSALLTPGGIPDQLYQSWRERRFTLITSAEQLEEFRRVTRYPRVRAFIEPGAAGSMHNELRHLTMLLTDLPTIELAMDPGDSFLLAMSQAGAADFLVTGDKHDLLSVGVFQKTRIVTARQLLERLGTVRARARKRPAKRRTRRHR